MTGLQVRVYLNEETVIVLQFFLFPLTSILRGLERKYFERVKFVELGLLYCRVHDVASPVAENRSQLECRQSSGPAISKPLYPCMKMRTLRTI